MKYVGIDLHKKTISACVVVKERGKKKVAARQRLECRDEAGIKGWFSELGKFEVVVEATSSYEWFVKLVEPLAHRVLLAQEQEAAGHRREQAEDGQAGRPGAGGVPGGRRDPAGLSSWAAGPRASHAGPLPALHPAAATTLRAVPAA